MIFVGFNSIVFLRVIILLLIVKQVVTELAKDGKETLSLTTPPIWHKPGCHRLGHTRLISIPGCLEFSLSTNACRGYCMSYSLPSSEDLSSPESENNSTDEMVRPNEDEMEVRELDGMRRKYIKPKLMSNEQESREQQQDIYLNLNHQAEDENEMMVVNKLSLIPVPFVPQDEQLLNHRLRRSIQATGRPNKQRKQTNKHRSHFNRFETISSSDREVTSFSQCCSMGKTEDITVNVRCGRNETRELVFHSALTCECFICKQT